MSETPLPPGPAIAPVVDERQAIDALAIDLLKVIETRNPTYEVSFAALASLVVGLSLQYVHAGTGAITPEAMSEQLTRFQAFTAQLGLVKMRTLNDQLTSLRVLEEHADTLKRHVGLDD